MIMGITRPSTVPSTPSNPPSRAVFISARLSKFSASSSSFFLNSSSWRFRRIASSFSFFNRAFSNSPSISSNLSLIFFKRSFIALFLSSSSCFLFFNFVSSSRSGGVFLLFSSICRCISSNSVLFLSSSLSKFFFSACNPSRSFDIASKCSLSAFFFTS